MKAFLEDIAFKLIEKYPKNMDEIAVVIPSKRAILFLKDYLSKKINDPIFLPRFFSIEDFIEMVSGLKILDNVSLQFYLYQSYLKDPLAKKDSFDEFLSWSNILLHDFNEVDRSMVDAELIFSNLKDVKELENWNVENWSLSAKDLTHSQQNFVTFYDKFYLWYQQFNKILLENNFAYQGMAYKKAADTIQTKKLQWSKIWFVGLNALTESEQQIIEFLKTEDIARVFWDADKYYLKDKYEAGSFLREQEKRWNDISFKGVGDFLSQKKKAFNIIACPKNIAQAKAGGQIISNLKEEDLTESNTAIVLADESLLYPVLHHLPTNVKELNITMGSPLRITPFYSLIESLFVMQLSANDYKKLAYYYKDVLLFISHPLLPRLVDTQYISDLRNYITKNNKIFISPKLIEVYLKEDYEKIRPVFTLWNNVTIAISAVDLLIALLRETLIGKKGTIDSEVLYAFSKSFNLLKKLISENKFSIELKTLNSILIQLIAKDVIPFQGEPLKGMQLMGILESRTLDFKNVIIMSVNEGFLPKVKSINSFIPFDMKLYFKMPTYRDRDAVYAYHFYRLLQRAQNITLLYSTQSDDFGSGEKSRFVTQLLTEYKGEIKHQIFEGNKLDLENKHLITMKNKGLDKQIESWANSVSPTALNMFIKCPLSFYFKYLAKINKEDEVEEFAEASTIGSAIHDAFKNSYIIGNIIPRQIKNIKPKLIKSIEIEFIKRLDGESHKEGKNYLSLEIAKKIIERFLDFEITYLTESLRNNNSLSILESEKDYAYKLKINNKEFNIKGTIDRVDTLGETLRIVDYKTGKVTSSEMSFDNWDDFCNKPTKAKAFQILLYAYLYLQKNPQYLDKKVIAGDFSFRNIREGLLTVNKKEGIKKNILHINKDILEEIEDQIVKVINRILTEDFMQTEEEKACKWCDYKAICNR